MAKKEKTIEVNVVDGERNQQPLQQVFIGKRLIGEVLTVGGRFKAILVQSEQEFSVHSQEEGLAMILQQYHLHQH